MKKILFLSFLSFAIASAQAQDTYMNDRLTNTSDINGTARYVGMGGAVGALGGEISGISQNPAGIGGFSRSWISLGMGGYAQAAQPLEGDSRAHYSFDQVGFVVVLPSDDSNRFNFAVNYQRKLNFGRSFMAENKSLGGLSQAAQLAGLASLEYSLDGALPYCSPYMGLYDVYRNDGSFYGFRANDNSYYRTTSGNLSALDINASGAVNNRFFWGATLGIDFLNYKSESSYVEFRDGYLLQEDAFGIITGDVIPVDGTGGIQDYTLEALQKVTGAGINFKLGTIICPIEDNPFRFGLTIESPTWYTLKQQDAYWTVYSRYKNLGETLPGSEQWSYNYLSGSGNYEAYDSPDDNYMEFNLRTPWKFRVSLADVHEGLLAWDVEYEYSLNNQTKMGYPTDESNGWGNQSTRTDLDRGMNTMTENIARGVHNLRMGLEVLPSEHWALRAGYNFYSSPFKSTARYDQSINSFAMNKTLGTDFTNLGAAHIVTFGFGYHFKGFYANAAYKYRMQKGDFYAFDDYYQRKLTPEAQFITDATSLKPVSVNLDRHDFTFTLGYEF